MVKKPSSLRNCVGCKRAFVPKTKNQKYHSDACRVEYYKVHYFAKTVVQKACPNCGTLFSTSMPKKQVYCLPACREEAKTKRIEAVYASTEAERVTYLGERMAAFERDEYKCTVCGRGVKDGAILDTVEEGAGLVTICSDCKIGKEEK